VGGTGGSGVAGARATGGNGGAAGATANGGGGGPIGSDGAAGAAGGSAVDAAMPDGAVVCPAGLGDCNHDGTCETELDTIDNCGGCGRPACELANVQSICVPNGPSCQDPVCRPGFGNCQRSSGNCETPYGASSTCFPRYLGAASLPGSDAEIRSVVAAPDGAVYYTGRYAMTEDFDPTPAVDTHASPGSADGFITKLNADGTYAWTKTLNGDFFDSIEAAAIAPDGGLVLVGIISLNSDLYPGLGIGPSAAGASTSPFVMKLDSTGTFVWARTFLANGDASRLAIAADGSLFVSGWYTGTANFGLSPGAVERSAAGTDVYVAKLTSAGDLIWLDTFDDRQSCGLFPAALAIGLDDVLWGTGYVQGTCDIDPGPADDEVVAPANLVTFLFSLDPATGDTRTTRAFEGSNGFSANLAVGEDGFLYLGGNFQGWVDFDAGPGMVVRDSGFFSNGYVLQLAADGTFRWVHWVPFWSVAAVGAAPGEIGRAHV
jgi:hypothetical protein